MSSPTVAVLSDPLFLAHDPGEGHPESPGRLTAILSELQRTGLLSRLAPVAPRPIRRDELERCHMAGLIDQVVALRGERSGLDTDTGVSPRSVDAAELAAGGGLELADAVLAGARGLALVRPPGHHATSDRSMGFCLFNNVALAAAHALAVRRLERILIVDWDVHHGNGIQDIFYRDSRVLYFSVHQYPHYPGTGHFSEIGEGEGLGRNVNVPFPAGATDGDVLEAFRHVLRPIANRFQPQLVLVSAGFDGHADDPLGDWRLTEAGFSALAGEIDQLAEDHCGGRWAAFLEGGYDYSSTARSLAAMTEVLFGGRAATVSTQPSAATHRLLQQVRLPLERQGVL